MNIRIFRTISIPALVLGAATLSIACILVVGMPVAWAQASGQNAVDITGYYGEKDGEFTRLSRNGETYQMLERHKTGDWIGVGVLQGDILAIGWHRSDGANLGVSLYKIDKDDKGPTLTGVWTAYPGGGVVKQALTRSRKLD